MSYVCSRCGGTSVTVLEGRPAVDARFAIGYCSSCTPVRKRFDRKTGRELPTTRSVIPLVEESLYQPDAAKAQRRRDADSRLVEQYVTGTIKGKGEEVVKAKQAQAEALFERWDREARDRRQP